VLAILACATVGPRVTAQASVAYLAIDLATNKPITTEQAAVIDTPVLPGSVMKIVTLAAALESGVISETSGILCTRDVTVGGRRLTCAHPDLHRPLTVADALAYSCDVFTATIAGRLSRSAFDAALTSLGLPASDPRSPLATAALGIDGSRIAPRRLVEMMARIAADPSSLRWKPTTLTAIREGLRGAVRYGTASALAAGGIDALAKTAATLTPAGLEQDLVVGVTPSTKPSIGFVLMTTGAGGLDAAAVAAGRLSSRPTTPATTSAAPGVRLGVSSAGGYAIRTVPLDDYVAGVLAGEAARDSSPAALEALAITIRTFALANHGRHGSDGFDLCDQTHCQVFRKATAATERAAAATAGQVLLYNGAPAEVFYSASCGGRTERPSEVWPGATDPPFLPSRKDDGCEGEPVWEADLTASDLLRALRAGGFKGDRLRDMRIAARNESGRATRLRLDGLTPNIISGQDLRTVVGRSLGWQHIKSTSFTLSRSGSSFHFAGHGSGHGVGMCVIGSVKLAARGESARQILARYFPGLTISSNVESRTTNAEPRTRNSASGTPNAESRTPNPVAGTPNPERRTPNPVTPNAERTENAARSTENAERLSVSLPEGDEGERAAIRDLAIRSRDSLAQRLGVQAPAMLALRFHPTVDSYQRATGKPWFTTAATTGTEINFVPLTVLRERGVLERTLRHELVHVLTEPAFLGRPMWVREGAALYFAGERSESARGRCPADRDFLQPVSPGALSAAYAQALACVAKQLDSGKKWNDVR